MKASHLSVLILFVVPFAVPFACSRAPLPIDSQEAIARSAFQRFKLACIAIGDEKVTADIADACHQLLSADVVKVTEPDDSPRSEEDSGEVSPARPSDAGASPEVINKSDASDAG